MNTRIAAIVHGRRPVVAAGRSRSRRSRRRHRAPPARRRSRRSRRSVLDLAIVEFHRRRRSRHELRRRVRPGAFSAVSRSAQRRHPRRVPLRQRDRSRVCSRRRPSHVGYRDQQYSASYNRYGKVKVSFEWNQTPLFFSQDTRDAVHDHRARRAAARRRDPERRCRTARRRWLASSVRPQPFDLRSQTRRARLQADLQPDRATSTGMLSSQEHDQERQPAVGGDVRVQRRRRVGGSPRHADDRAGTARRMGGQPAALARLGYDGSFFRNNIGTLTWDNPLRVTDSPTAGPLQGRMALWPNSNMNTASATRAR